MTQSASQAWAFYREVAKNRVLWTIRDDAGFPAPITSEGKRSQPFWSSLSRVKRIIKSVAAYSGFSPFQVSWDEFRAEWVPTLTADGCLVGVNWSGKNAVGYDIEPERLEQSVLALIENPTQRAGAS